MDQANENGQHAIVSAKHDSTNITTTTIKTVSFTTALLAGGFAGTCADVMLYPIDTIKTRLQSPVGFLASGGFRGVYNGVGVAALGSAPGAALFFSTYEYCKPVIVQYQNTYLKQQSSQYDVNNSSISHMIAASIGEAVACLVRVPTDVVKARMQTAAASTPSSPNSNTVVGTIRIILQEKQPGSFLSTNLTGGLTRGYGITLFREIPFAMIQFPLYEKFKVMVSEYNHERQQKQQHNNMNGTYSQSADGDTISPCTPFQAAACGSFSGAIAAAITTPLDVLKTRLMLGKDRNGHVYRGVVDVFVRTVRDKNDGYRALWSGIQPRVFWITLGGFIFFGAYEEAKTVIQGK